MIPDPTHPDAAEIVRLCNAIVAGYAAGHSGLDDSMIFDLVALGDFAEVIAERFSVPSN